MKNKIFNTFKIMLVLALLTAIRPVKAQSMQMHHQHSSAGKNMLLTLMDSMMVQMSKLPKATSPESDFIQQMIPHHEGAVAMAKYEIQHGKDFNMIQLARSILTEQTSEIQQMNLWLKQISATDKEMPSGYQQSMNQSMQTMMNTMPSNEQLTDIDHAFAAVMVPHHQAAVDMAKIILKYSGDQLITGFAKQLISLQQVEIEQMSLFLNK
ncbi:MULTISPECIES: DUF305 domain-containing protein [Dyadobacter]|jgi:uncharacterized protein (DUF305 family)|uniref:DUF305 domain-containing protein n=3 Tax=Dyadobacter TaxID=120831 RepID=A0A5R9K6A3_9BACT|nr:MULTISPECIES: DUF305 domain-containing protein [Dyadobacter]TDE09765.1 DUF305 domain-containing protein [Dyadobacter psychrotolerans]TLU89320.1 DUF305 domain-containing protein [Dyadobacter sediminis]GGC06477.1 hypothetical protein GCM10011325_36640 [Dyadobacter sediminis]SKC19879.1 Uncharacterized conserved protein, DUF305 family [Dyadobacter psychrophilus]